MSEPQPLVRNVVGVMTGTSIDGIDAALVRITGKGLGIRAALVQHLSAPLGDLQMPLRAAVAQTPMPAGEFARLAWDFGILHADVIDQLLAERDHSSIHARDAMQLDLICVHGQTIFHQPPNSWQLVNIAPIAARFACPIVSDLRQADLAHGGQGAPITPIADWILFRDENNKRAIVNLGGFCNVTIVPAWSSSSIETRAGTSSCREARDLSAIAGFDVCACNQLLDAIARKHLHSPFDDGGAAAGRGRAKPQALSALQVILDRQRVGGRSLGTGDEALAWMSAQTESGIAPDDLAASAVEAIAQTIAASLATHHVDEIILAGGGARNRALHRSIERHARTKVVISDNLGVPLEAREAMCFAILGALCQDGVAITLPQVTGCEAPAAVTGVWQRGLGPG